MLLALSLGGTAMVSATFTQAYTTQTERITKENQMMMSEITALIANYNRSIFRTEEDALKGVLAALSDNWASDGKEYRVTDATGVQLIASDGMVSVPVMIAESSKYLNYRIFRSGDKYYMQAVTVLKLLEQSIMIENCNDITGIFNIRNSQKNLFVSIIIVIGSLSAIMNAVITIWLTRPIIALTQATKSLAGGDMKSRVQVNVSDEIGVLADSFNQMADSLQENIRMLEEAAQRQEDFVGSFAHEIKTPLTSIIGYADLLRTGMLPVETAEKAANYIFTEGKRLESLSLKLLELIVENKSEPQYTYLSLKTLVEEVTALVKQRLEDKSISLISEIPDITVRLDRDLMKSVLVNVFDNAIKAVDINGSIGIKAYILGELIELSITDNGIGIPLNELDRITESFYMVDKSRSRQEGGAGLGLALCSRIMNLHGGKISFESELGKGTRVILTWKGVD